MRLRRILAAAAIVVVALAAASAAKACDPHRVNDGLHYYDGWWIPDYNTKFACLFGDEAEIYVTNPTVVAPNGGGQISSSMAWTGVQFESTSSGAKYVLGQMGYENLYGGGGDNWASINDGGADWKTASFTRPANGTYQEYEVVYSYSNNTFHFYYNQTDYYNWKYTGSDGQLGCNWQTNALSESEITSLANQMPGTAVNNEVFTTNYVMSNGGSWYQPLSGWLNVNSSGTHFGNLQGFDQYPYDDTWDKCS